MIRHKVYPIYRAEWVTGIHLEILFPNLQTSNWHLRSPQDGNYNCFAWAACDQARRWEPSPVDYWPAKAPRTLELSSFVIAFGLDGYEPCGLDTSYEFGYQKIAIYCELWRGVKIPAHMARQDLLGRGWLSKLGDYEDILHPRLGDVESTAYGSVELILKRRWFGIEFCGDFVRWLRAEARNYLYRLRRPHGI